MKGWLKSEFEMKDLGESTKILGICIKRNREKGVLTLTQKDYIQKIIEKFAMKGSKTTKRPMTNQHCLSKEQCPKTQAEIEEMSKVPYSNVVGSIMYLMVCTRPDLAYSISVLSKYMENPGLEHCRVMKWVFRYLLGTTDIGLKFTKYSNSNLIDGYSDADFAGDRDHRKSTSAYYFLVGSNCVSWRVQLQPIVALSTTELEYVAIIEAIKEAIWIKGIMEELKLLKEILTVYSDS
ncbi:secreted RxLR effector protein 161-like [Humulus lupulus]|uniref:secreted RxLR effector protein 161-like n=1 Tax=Humulus lupulus TaxID=3486 RepID=UPI002B4108A0|nr:secreted RxLR effector protein 161-like [Humulus lupulus]